MPEEKKLNLYQRMSAITQEISTVAKNLNVGIGKNQYKAVGEADVLAAVKPIEAKYGVYSYPFSREIVDSGEMVSTSTYNGQSTEKRQVYMRVATVYRFVNTDEPAEHIDIQTYGDGIDSQDKAPGKAMTYGDKYALLKAYKIQTGDDPDQNYSEPLKGVNREKKKPGKNIQEQPPVIDRTGEAAYPPIEDMTRDVEAYTKKSKSANDYITSCMKQAGARDIAELAFTNPGLITAVWNKWCNK